MRVAVVAEYYPRARDPVLGVWAHRQALAARDAGADVRVVVLHRPVPSRAAVRSRDPRAVARAVAQPLRAELDGLDVLYVPFLAPPRPRSYASWGAWAAPSLALVLRRLSPDLVHAHYAAPAGDAVARSGVRVPVVVSVHGGDVLGVVARGPTGRAAVHRGLSRARLVLANSQATARLARRHGAAEVRVVHLGTDVPERFTRRSHPPTLVTVAHVVARKRHGDVLRAMWLLRDSHPDLTWTVVGDGPELEPLRRLAGDLGLLDRVRLLGALPPAEAVREAQRGTIFVLPSIDEAFGVAYVEAMAGGVPAIGCLGEGGPEEIAGLGDGLRLVPPGDPEVLAAQLRALLDHAPERRELGLRARETVREHFTWERCGTETVAAYEAALRP